jgi:hypothetical protein
VTFQSVFLGLALGCKDIASAKGKVLLWDIARRQIC